MFYAIAGVLGGVGVILIFVGRGKGALKQEMDRTQTTSIRALRQGDHAEIKGVATCDAPLAAPYSGIPCVYYSYNLKRREEKRSSDGSTSHSWRTIDSGSTRVPFVLTDGTGSVSIDPDEATFDAPVVLKGPVEVGQMRDGIKAAAEGMEPGFMKSALGAAARLPLGSHPDKVTVHAVQVERDLYVLGDVQQGTDGQVRISSGENKFFISTESEEKLSKKLGRQLIVFYVLGVAFIVGGVGVLVMGLR